MTCAGDGSTGTTTVMWPFENWSRTRSHIVPMRFQPTKVSQLVAIVQAAERISGVVRAVGSGWSYPDVAIAPEVKFAITTDSLSATLNGGDGTLPEKMIPFALNDAARADATHYIHVQAGIKVHDLNCALDAMGLAMITLGGSNGQSLAGAISTSTHGSDIDLPPIADVVRAIHLVGPGGQEWWIERSGTRAITDRSRMDQARFAGLLCDDIRIEYDDLLFNAALVSVGRMGIVYSYVVKVTDAFMLRQRREKKPWSEVQTTIRTKIRDAMTEAQFVEIVINPYRNTAGQNDCVVTRKTTVTDPPTAASGSSAQTFALFCNIPSMNVVLDAIALLLPPLIATAAGAAVAGLSWMLLIPIAGPELFATASAAAVTLATAALVTLETAVLAARAEPGEDLAQKIASILNSMTGLGHKELVPMLTELLLFSERNPNEQDVVGPSFQVLTGQVPCDQTWVGPPECLRQINGLEFALDLSPGSEKLFGFIDDVLMLTDEFLIGNMPAAFGMSLRFTKGTEALIGIQQATRNCMVEFIMLRGMIGQDDFLKRLNAIARKHDAIPHWGLMHEIDATEVARLYGQRLRDWRLALGRLIEQGSGKTETFRTSYSVVHGLEPLTGGLVISDSRPAAIRLWDPTPQVEGTTTSTGIYLWNRSNHATQVTDLRITSLQDVPGAPVFRVNTNLPFSIPAGQVFLASVTFSPRQGGPITGMVEVGCDDPVTPTLRLPLRTSATALGRHAELQLSPSQMDLGTILVGGTTGRNLTLTNTGFYPAYFDSIAVILDQPSGQFAVPFVLPSSLMPGQSDTLYVSFNPMRQGAARATLAVDMRSRTDVGTVDYRHRYEVPLSGRALRPIIFLAGGPQPAPPAAPDVGPIGGSGLHRPPPLGPLPLRERELQVLDFGATAPGTSAAAPFWIRNVGDAPLTVQGVVVVNQGSFGITNPTIFPAALAPNEELEVACNFLAYSVPGMRASGEFRVLSDDPLRPTATLVVTGKAAGPHLTDPSEMFDLGVVPPQPGSATLTFRSDGTDPVTVRKVSFAIGADFEISGVPQLPTQVPPGTNLTLTVTLLSTQSGMHQDQLIVAHDGRPSGSSQVLIRARVP